MKKPEDKDTRYYIDVDRKNLKVVGWDYGQRQDLVVEELSENVVRIYITKGQFNKLQK